MDRQQAPGENKKKPRGVCVCVYSILFFSSPLRFVNQTIWIFIRYVFISLTPFMTFHWADNMAFGIIKTKRQVSLFLSLSPHIQTPYWGPNDTISSRSGLKQPTQSIMLITIWLNVSFSESGRWKKYYCWNWGREGTLYWCAGADGTSSLVLSIGRKKKHVRKRQFQLHLSSP